MLVIVKSEEGEPADARSVSGVYRTMGTYVNRVVNIP